MGFKEKTMNKPVYRMSGAGTCARALSAARQGYKPEGIPPWLQTAADEGKWHEGRIRQELKDLGYTVGGDQKEVRIEYPSFSLVGHIDGILLDNKEPFTKMLLEIKSMSQFEFDRWMKEGFNGFKNYAAQITCYMEALGLEQCLYVVKNRSSGYKNTNIFTGQPGDINAIIQKITDIEEWLAKNIEPGARDGVYPAEFDPNSLECRRCFYKYLCIPEQKELTPVDQNKLEVATAAWRTGKRLVDDGQAMIDSAKEILKQHTKATGINKWRFDELAISLIQVESSITYPKKNLLEQFTEEELMKASNIKLPYDFIKITDLKKEEDEK